MRVRIAEGYEIKRRQNWLEKNKHQEGEKEYQGVAFHSPTLAPRSNELSALIERSGFTLPMIWAALPVDR